MSYYGSNHYAANHYGSNYYGAQQAQGVLLDPLGPSSLAYQYLYNLGYRGGLSTMRKDYLGRSSTGSQEKYDILRSLGYNDGLSTMMKQFLEDNT